MQKTKTISIDREKTLARFYVLLGIALIAPFIGHQAITGTIVNAILFVSTAVIGLEAGVLIGLIPSVVSLGLGLLPTVLAPMIPLIIMANSILVIAFNRLKGRSFWLAVTSAGILKFMFLFGTGSLMMNFYFKKEIARAAAAMMTWPQLFTALAGGLIAYLILKIWKK